MPQPRVNAVFFMSLQHQHSNSREILSVEQVSNLLGLHEKTVYKMKCANDIPYHQHARNKKIYFLKGEIMEWIKGQKENS